MSRDATENHSVLQIRAGERSGNDNALAAGAVHATEPEGPGFDF